MAKSNDKLNKMPILAFTRDAVAVVHLFQLYASQIDKTILANGIV